MKTLIVCILLSSMLLSACSATRFVGYYFSSGDGSGGTLSGDVYKTEDTSYRIGSLPSGWSRQDVDGGDLVFQNTAERATITVNSNCDGKKVKHHLPVLSDSLVIGISGKELISRDETVVDGQPALYSIYQGSFDNVPIKISTLIFKKGSCIYEFTYASSPDNFQASEPQFKAFTSEFRVL